LTAGTGLLNPLSELLAHGLADHGVLECGVGALAEQDLSVLRL
jgi:hypothetical protein